MNLSLNSFHKPVMEQFSLSREFVRGCVCVCVTVTGIFFFFTTGRHFPRVTCLLWIKQCQLEYNHKSHMLSVMVTVLRNDQVGAGILL